MPLRDYQIEALKNVNAAMAEGINKQLIVLPTGCGKTLIFSQIPKAIAMRPGEQLHVIVQRDELCWQSMEKLQKGNPDLNVSLEKAEYRADPKADIIVSSIQTLGIAKTDDAGDWVYSDRLKRFDPSRVRAVVTDEAHHLTAKQYAGMLRYFQVYKPEFQYDDPSKLLIGTTATPNRSDNQGLELLFDKIVFNRDLRDMIEKGWLADIRAFRVDTMVDISDVGVRQGDFAIGELEETVNTPARNKLIVEKYLEIGKGLPGLAFTVDVQHSVDLADAFQKAGIKAYAISGKTPKEDRRKLIQMYSEGSIQVLISCQVLLEGFDAPRATVALCCRPTKSKLLYTQSIGRVLRPYPAPEEAQGWTKYVKECAIVIDFVDVSSKHQLLQLASLFGLRPGFDTKGKKVTQALGEIEKLVGQTPGVNLSLYDNMDKLKAAVQEINLFGKTEIPEEIRRNSQLAWVTGMATGTYQINFDKTTLSIKQNTLGQYEMFRHIQGIRTSLGTAGDLGRALSLAEIEVPSEWYTRLQAEASWRNKPVSDEQLGFFAKLYPEVRRMYASDAEFATGIRAKFNKGQISQKIDERKPPSRAVPSWVKRR